MGNKKLFGIVAVILIIILAMSVMPSAEGKTIRKNGKNSVNENSAYKETKNSGFSIFKKISKGIKSIPFSITPAYYMPTEIQEKEQGQEPEPQPLAWVGYSSAATRLITDAATSDLGSGPGNDIVLGHGVYDSSPPTGRVSVWENNGNIDVNTWTRYYTTLANYVYSVAVGDIDGDGKKDVVAGTAGSSNNLVVLKNSGTNLNVNQWQKYLFTPTVSNPAAINAVKVVDLNKDGKNEILAGGGAGSTVYVIDTKGVFDTAQWQVYAIEVPGLIHELSVGDINNDNYDDIVVATGFAGVGSARGVFAAINPPLNRTLDISAWTTYNRPYAENVYSVAIGDIDGNGNDIVIGSGVTYNRVAVLYNDGTLTGNINNWALYEKSVSGTMGGGVGAVAVGDLNPGTDKDIVSGFLVLVQKFIIWDNAIVQDINSWPTEENLISGTARTLVIDNLDASSDNEIIAGINEAAGNTDSLTIYKNQ